MTMGLFVGIWVARYLGPEQFGLFSYAQSFTFLFAAIATLGLDGIVIRELIKDASRFNVLMGTAFFLKLIGAALLFPILFFAINFTNNDSFTNWLIFIIASSTIFQSFNVIDFYCQSKVLSKYVAWTNSISLLISSVMKITLILNDAPLVFFAYVVLFDAIVVSLGLIYFYTKKMHLDFSCWRFNFSMARELLMDSWPLILSSIVVSIYMKIDQIMIKEMMNPEAVGQYAAAVRLSEVWYFIPVTIVGSVFPAIINAKKVSIELYCFRIKKLYTSMIWMAISIALPMTFLSKYIVLLLYGNDYQLAGDVLMIHIWTGIFVFLGVAFSQYLISENLAMKSFYRTATGATVNIFLNFLLIPYYGIVGAAMATLVGQAAANLLYDFFDKDLRGHLLVKISSFVPFNILKGN
ncbi:flippase [Marinomonas polaris]|uniref:flippase n=1 Tax=Marinomonas polaris TaxID=293552 RepID=UPI003517D935